MPTTVRDGYILKIKAVLFDLGDTLTTQWLLEDTFHKILLSLGINKPIEDVKRAISQTRQDLRNLDCCPKYGEASYTEYWSLWRSFVLKHLGLHDNERLLREIEAKWSNYVECKAYDDVKEILLKLEENGLKTAVISTAYKEDVHTIMEKAGLQERMFDLILGADSLEAMKPDPEAFRYALKKLGVKPREALFVGDDVEADYKAAEKAGIKAVLIQRTEDSTVETCGLRVITTLKDVLECID